MILRLSFGLAGLVLVGQAFGDGVHLEVTIQATGAVTQIGLHQGSTFPGSQIKSWAPGTCESGCNYTHTVHDSLNGRQTRMYWARARVGGVDIYSDAAGPYADGSHTHTFVFANGSWNPPPAATNYVHSGCITNNTALSYPISIYAVGQGDGAGNTDVVYDGTLLPGEVQCWEITKPWPFDVFIDSWTFSDGNLIKDTTDQGSGSPVEAEEPVNEQSNTGSGGNIHDTSGGATSGGGAPSVGEPTPEARGTNFLSGVEQAIQQLNANDDARAKEFRSLMISAAAAEQANFNALLGTISAEGQRAHLGDIGIIQAINGLGSKLDIIATNTTTMAGGMNTNGLSYGGLGPGGSGVGYQGTNDAGLGAALTAELPVIVVPAAEAPGIVIPLSALDPGLPSVSLEDVEFDLSMGEFATWVPMFRGLMLVAVTWAFVLLFWRTIAQFGGVT
jgi:hypothetical protein